MDFFEEVYCADWRLQITGHGDEDEDFITDSGYSFNLDCSS